MPSKLPKWGILNVERQENSDYIAKYINKENCLKIKKRRYKISKRILKLFAVVIMVNRINSLIKAKRTFTLNESEFKLMLSLEKVYTQSMICKW